MTQKAAQTATRHEQMQQQQWGSYHLKPQGVALDWEVAQQMLSRT
jgi:hypothetical protein